MAGTGMRGSCRGRARVRSGVLLFPAGWKLDPGGFGVQPIACPRVAPRGEAVLEMLLLVAVSEGFAARSRAELRWLSRLGCAFRWAS